MMISFFQTYKRSMTWASHLTPTSFIYFFKTPQKAPPPHISPVFVISSFSIIYICFSLKSSLSLCSGFGESFSGILSIQYIRWGTSGAPSPHSPSARRSRLYSEKCLRFHIGWSSRLRPFSGQFVNGKWVWKSFLLNNICKSILSKEIIFTI